MCVRALESVRAHVCLRKCLVYIHVRACPCTHVQMRARTCVLACVFLCARIDVRPQIKVPTSNVSCVLYHTHKNINRQTTPESFMSWMFCTRWQEVFQCDAAHLKSFLCSMSYTRRQKSLHPATISCPPAPKRRQKMPKACWNPSCIDSCSSYSPSILAREAADVVDE